MNANYSQERNKAAGNKGAAVTGVSTAVAAVLTWAVTEFGLDLSPEVQAMIVTAASTIIGYAVSRIRNYMKHS